MTDKNKVSQAVMDELDSSGFHGLKDVASVMQEISRHLTLRYWVYVEPNSFDEVRSHEMAVVNKVIYNDDNFEVKTPTWVIVSRVSDEDGYWCVLRKYTDSFNVWGNECIGSRSIALVFATRITDPKLKDALLYANKDFKAIEVEE